MSRSDIKRLQQEGRLDDALEMAMGEYVKDPNALWAKYDLAWVYDAKCKDAATKGDVSSFAESFQPIVKLDVLAINEMLSDTLCWRFRALLANGSSQMEASDKPLFAQQVFEMVKSLGQPHPSESYSVLCKAFYHLRENWAGFIDFMEWWGWETFRPEDYNQEKLPNGKLMPLSLVEGCYIAYAKLLLQVGDRLRISEFLPRLEALSEAHPEMLYTGYYTGKLLISVGGERQAMLQKVLPFVRRKSGEFWAWQLLAEVMHDNEKVYLACLLRAVNCKTQDTFLVRVLYLLVNLSLSHSDYVAARLFLKRYVAAKTAAQSRLSADVVHWIDEPWYKDTLTEGQKSEILQMDYQAITNEVLFADIPERPACIVHYDAMSRWATVVYGTQERGRIRIPKSMKNVCDGTCLMTRIGAPTQESDKLTCYTIRRIKWEELPPTSFLRMVEGEVTANRSNSAFFVKFGKKFAFIPNELYKGKELKVGSKITAHVVLDYQKNKSCWSWRCLSYSSR